MFYKAVETPSGPIFVNGFIFATGHKDDAKITQFIKQIGAAMRSGNLLTCAE